MKRDYPKLEWTTLKISSQECRKTGNFNLPIKRKRDKSWKIRGNAKKNNVSG